MKNFIPIAFAIILQFFVISCTKEDQVQDTVQLSSKTLTFSTDGGYQSILVTTSGAWKMSGDSDWCKPSLMAGDGSSLVFFAISPNSGYSERSTKYTFSCGSASAILTVTQKQKDALSVSNNLYKIDNMGGQIDIVILSNVPCSYEIDSSCKDWISYVQTKSLSETVFSFVINRNESTDDRSGKINFSGNNLRQTVSIIQQHDIINVNNPRLVINGKASQFEVAVNTNINEYEVIIPTGSWINYVETKALRTERIILSASANLGRNERIETIEIKDKNSSLSQTVEIIQCSQIHGIYDVQDYQNFTSEVNKITSERDSVILLRYGQFNTNTSQWNFWLENDLDFANAEVTPIGASTNPTDFVFDAKGHSITNFCINNSLNDMGMFSVIGSTSMVANLTLNGSITNLKESANTGGICGQNFGAVKNCTNNASVTASLTDCVANIAGVAGLNRGTITSSSNSGSIYVSSTNVPYGNYDCYIGGIVGLNYGTIINTLNSGSVKIEGNVAGYVGGIVGKHNIGRIYNSKNTGKLLALLTNNTGKKVWAGGIAARSDNNSIIEFCSNTADINLAENDNNPAAAGGIVGWNILGYIFGCYNTGNISTSYPSHYLNYKCMSGGIVGDGGNVVGCYNLGDVYANLGSAGGICGECLTDVIAYGSYNAGTILPGCSIGGLIFGRKYNIARYYGCYAINDEQAGVEGIVSKADAKTIISELNEFIGNWNNAYPTAICTSRFFDNSTDWYPVIKETVSIP